MPSFDRVREKYGTFPDPLEGVPLEHIEEAKQTAERWSTPTRGGLRLITSILKMQPAPEWKMGVYRRIFASVVLSSASDRLRMTAWQMLGQIDPDFTEVSAAFTKQRRQTRRASRGR